MIRIYALSEPVTGELRYVGQTALTLENRLKSHTWDSTLAHKNHRTKWLKKLISQGLLPIIELLEEVSESEANDAERFWITQFKALGCRLINVQEGGIGWTRGQKRPGLHTPESRAKTSKALKGRKK